jgi:hypothetical protein
MRSSAPTGWPGLAALALLLAGCFDAIPADTLTPGSAGAVRGTVSDSCSGQSVGAVTIAGGGRSTTTDQQGRFLLEDLAAGPLTLTASRSGYRTAQPEVLITGEATASLEITLAPLPGSGQPLARELDVLFVIDTSASMVEEQHQLALAFPAFVNAVAGTFDNLRVGVISSDLGAGPHALENCAPGGSGARLLNTPRTPGCGAPTDPYLEIDQGRVTNAAETDPGAAFSCIARLGTNGCGFEQPLEALRLALDGAEPGGTGINAGFVRPSAMLAIIVVTDEDDCSAADGAQLFDPNNTDQLGPLNSFRCFEYGVRCDSGGRAPGPRTGCRPAEPGLLHGLSRYADFLAGLKTSAFDLFFAVVAGPSDPVEVKLDGDSPILAESCSSSLGSAAPAVRLEAVVNALNPALSPKPSYTICSSELPMRQIGQQLLGAALANTCP